MSKAAQLYGWKQTTQWTKITFCISHTHTIKIGEVRTNRVKTEYGMGPSVYGWGQCGRGLRTVHGWGQYEWESQQYHGRIIMYYMGGDNYGSGLLAWVHGNSMGNCMDKANQLPHARHVNTITKEVH